MSGYTTPQAPRNGHPRHRGIGRRAAAVTGGGLVFGLIVGLGSALPAQAASPQEIVTLAQSGAKTTTVTVAKKKKLTRKQRNQAIARKLVAKRGWSKRQYRCLVSLWNRESGWNHRAYNSRTGAGGIPQALPASKMGSAGKDWRTNPATQIKWGLRYIKGRYGTPCSAWAHFGASGWY